MSILIKLLIKYIIAEQTLNILFDGITHNFVVPSPLNDPSNFIKGNRFKKIVYYNPHIEYTFTLYNVYIEKTVDGHVTGTCDHRYIQPNGKIRFQIQTSTFIFKIDGVIITEIVH